jgi:hypothetical protein
VFFKDESSLTFFAANVAIVNLMGQMKFPDEARVFKEMVVVLSPEAAVFHSRKIRAYTLVTVRGLRFAWYGELRTVRLRFYTFIYVVFGVLLCVWYAFVTRLLRVCYAFGTRL